MKIVRIVLMGALLVAGPVAAGKGGEAKPGDGAAAGKVEIKIRSDAERKREQERRATEVSPPPSDLEIEQDSTEPEAPEEDHPWYNPFGIFGGDKKDGAEAGNTD